MPGRTSKKADLGDFVWVLQGTTQHEARKVTSVEPRIVQGNAEIFVHWSSMGTREWVLACNVTDMFTYDGAFGDGVVASLSARPSRRCRLSAAVKKEEEETASIVCVKASRAVGAPKNTAKPKNTSKPKKRKRSPSEAPGNDETKSNKRKKHANKKALPVPDKAAAAAKPKTDPYNCLFGLSSSEEEEPTKNPKAAKKPPPKASKQQQTMRSTKLRKDGLDYLIPTSSDDDDFLLNTKPLARKKSVPEESSKIASPKTAHAVDEMPKSTKRKDSPRQIVQRHETFLYDSTSSSSSSSDEEETKQNRGSNPTNSPPPVTRTQAVIDLLDSSTDEYKNQQQAAVAPPARRKNATKTESPQKDQSGSEYVPTEIITIADAPRPIFLETDQQIRLILPNGKPTNVWFKCGGSSAFFAKRFGKVPRMIQFLPVGPQTYRSIYKMESEIRSLPSLYVPSVPKQYKSSDDDADLSDDDDDVADDGSDDEFELLCGDA